MIEQKSGGKHCIAVCENHASAALLTGQSTRGRLQRLPGQQPAACRPLAVMHAGTRTASRDPAYPLRPCCQHRTFAANGIRHSPLRRNCWRKRAGLLLTQLSTIFTCRSALGPYQPALILNMAWGRNYLKIGRAAMTSCIVGYTFRIPRIYAVCSSTNGCW
jgi:hypothetical protein